MGHLVALTALASIFFLGLLGCGGAKQTTTTQTRDITSYTCISGCGVHHSKVKQVEAAFAAQGLRLRKPKHALSLGYTLLLHGHQRPRLVTVVVASPHGTRSTLVILGAAKGRYHTQRDANVRVYFDPSNTQPVQAALAHLR